ncbi:hypothetical protein GPECTOR_5g282 [Gonium pectorale]|uniref:mannose-6-phosphate isomerase n=1 Tax=Gonium pectorale TaxID=33097 RepID=A0A150GWB7_GONPE|nr:hypothetical protein GPECTOR_5g282 [Gonium pectorale]|eukprot:KXZ54187.1 hypothetical protein GPECTOR_5g282 [Gonium pectorale]
MKVEFTLRRFPINARLKEESGLPFSAVLQPYHRLSDKEAAAGNATDVRSEDIVRCNSCYAYINCYCSFDSAGWVCSLCNRHNGLRPQQLKRYARAAGCLAAWQQRAYRLDAELLQSLPEVRSDVFETLAAEPIPIEDPAEEGARDQPPVSGPAPVVVALVDTAAGEDFLELVRSSLAAALEALPPVTRFALVSMSDRVGLHDVRGEEPTVRFVPLTEPAPAAAAGGPGAAASRAAAVAAPLSSVLPLADLLVPVWSHKAALTRAIEENLVPEQGFGDAVDGATDAAGPGGTASGAPGQQAGMSRSGGGGPAGRPACRGLGPSLLALLDYLKARFLAAKPVGPWGHVLQAHPFLPPPSQQAGGDGNWGGGDGMPHQPSPVKLLVFLAGVPDFGLGRLVNPRRRRAARAAAATAAAAAAAGGSSAAPPPPPPDPDAWMDDVPSSSVEFYEQAAAAAASLGVSCDLFAVSPSGLGLRWLAPLAGSTGGSLYLYPSVDESAMPQDVYLRLSAPSCSSGLLRLRTSPHFKTARHYGRMFADPALPDLHHIVAADASDSFAVDFEFSSPSGFSSASVAAAHPPTLQVAFQYTSLVCERLPPQQPRQQQPAPGVSAATPPRQPCEGRRYWLQRRLRVATFRVGIAATVGDLYAHVAPEAVLTVLMHKVARAAEAQGLNEARLLLRDWLVVLALAYHRNLHSALTPPQLAEVPADLNFSSAPLLAPLPRLVYALLRSPLLAPSPPPLPPPTSGGSSGGAAAGEGQHPDLTAFLAHLWGGLPPGELSYTNPDTPAFPRHSLSRAAVCGPDAPPIFLLDAYILILVFYTNRCPPGLPFPPPQQSALRRAVAAIRSERRITPQVKILREGGEDSELFETLMLDEPDAHLEGEEGHHTQQQPEAEAAGGSGNGGSSGGASGFGLVQFLEHIRSEVAKLAKANGNDIDESKPFAELWMGAHPNCPSKLASTGESLQAHLDRYPQLLGGYVQKHFGQLPYLFKVLSVAKALSIQSHPDKELAEKLHRDHPKLYADPNHKPEMALALSDFEALCGFATTAELQARLRSVPELAELVGEAQVAALLALPAEGADGTDAAKKALKAAFTSLMTASQDRVTAAVRALVERLRGLQADQLSPHEALALRLNGQFPDDVGLMSAFFLNLITLPNGHAIYLPANEPHAYLAGELVECMAASDNVIRAGLTPKFKHADVLCESLTYRQGLPEVLTGEHVAPSVKVYQPPFEEFEIQRIEAGTVSLAAPSLSLEAVEGPRILLVQSGEAEAAVEGGLPAVLESVPELESGAALRRGSIVLLPAGVALAVKGAKELVIWVASVNSTFIGLQKQLSEAAAAASAAKAAEAVAA